jgi:hypothetical protein
MSERTNISAPVVRLPPALLLAVSAAAIFVSATLLFVVQPMFTKMVLPQLGGSASVWTMAMVFFQSVLLGGYVYAHCLARYVPNRAAVPIHLAVMSVACAWLPLHVAEGWGLAPASREGVWLLTLFLVSIGLPFFALSANGSLLQYWFSRSEHPASKDPYFLYFASNAGSLLALVSYPVVIEPALGLRDQAGLWTIAYVIAILLVGTCGMLALASTHASRPIDASGMATDAAPSWRAVLSWVGLAAVPSGLLLAVTAHISTDVAAVPLFWVVPLALYLLAFIIAFQTKPFISHALVIKVFPIFILIQVLSMMIDPLDRVIIILLVDLSTFFVVALLCHGELARRRPAPLYLTNFYMWIAAGGALGGISTGLIAPHVFSWVAEYPLLIGLAILCLPWPRADYRKRYMFIGGLAVILQLLFTVKALGLRIPFIAIAIMQGLLLGLTVYVWKSPPSFAAMVGVVLLLGYSCFNCDTYNILIRNFFGVLYAVESTDGRFRTLSHGTIGQGTQEIRDRNGKLLTGRPQAIAEFFDGAGIAQVTDAIHARLSGPASYGVIGLGTGALACRTQPQDTITYYEIDPDVIRIARDTKLFSYISGCQPDAQVIQGDARLSLAAAPDGAYDVVFVDAFLGAAIPVHLLTREAVALYFRKLNSRGILAVHVSNRNLELASVVVGAAEANGAITRVYLGGDVKSDPDENKWVPHVAVAARRDEDFGMLSTSRFWPLHTRAPGERIWSDDYSDVLSAMVRKLKDRGRPDKSD